MSPLLLMSLVDRSVGREDDGLDWNVEGEVQDVVLGFCVQHQIAAE